MSKLKSIREKQNLTQEELSERSGISVRTIQRIEAGADPKGYTLRVLSEKLGVQEMALQDKQPEAENAEEDSKNAVPAEASVLVNHSMVKLINLSSIPFIVLPPLNVLVPLIIIFATKQKSPLTRQIVSVQMMWTILAPILFLLVVLTKPGNGITLGIMLLLALSNVWIVLRNALNIDRKNELYYRLNFNLI
ncbi:MAG: helix-turn-helix domain-containing protein [Sphingobacteriia bacterium]|nr:helix-turn-helix domain-containing protein [Sphingobacteriia bacterium]